MIHTGESLYTDATPEPTLASHEADRRRHARLRQQSLLSNVGPVIDLSRTGLRIMTSRRRRGVVDLVLFDLSGRRLNLRARVVWSKRLAFRKHMLGLEFEDADEELTRDLARLGTTGFVDA